MRNRLQTEVHATAMEANDYLPPELISDVLSRLPAKSVGRFRCVCKDWQSLLSDPQFLKIHFNLQNRRATKAVYRDETSLISVISVDFHKDGNNHGGPVPIYETLNFKDRSYRYKIEGSCNGLLLLLDTVYDELSIINPITLASRKLPALPPNFANYRTFGFGANYQRFGFGANYQKFGFGANYQRFGFGANYRTFGFSYNSSIDDYIVAAIFKNRTDHSVSVYVLKRNCWKMVKNCPFAFAFGSCIIVNGAIHMLGTRISDKSTIICALDLASERFQEVEQPEGLKEQHVILLNVNVLGRCLCLSSRNTGIGNTDIWVMKEYGVSKSWTKYTYDGFFSRFKPLFLWGGDEFMVGVADGRVALCSLNKTHTIPVFAKRRPLLVHHCTCWTFTDSLFSPNRNNVVDEPNEV